MIRKALHATRTTLGAVIVAIAGICSLASISQGAIYDAAADFNVANNPNGVWSYGSEATFGTGFTLLPNSNSNWGGYGGVDAWTAASGSGLPGVFKNTNLTPITIYSTVVLGAGELALHPGPGGEYGVVEFTAPTSGYYNYAGLFAGRDTGGTTTDVHILRNGVAIFNDNVNGYLDSHSFSGSVFLGVGDVLDFAVGFGSNNTYYNDSTLLDVQIAQAVPEPATMTIWGLGALGLAFAGYRRRMSATPLVAQS